MVDALGALGASSTSFDSSGSSGSSSTPFADLSDIGNDTTQFGAMPGQPKKKEGIGPLASLAATIGGMVALHRFGPALADKPFVKSIAAQIRKIPGGNKIVDFIKKLMTRGAKAAKEVVEDGAKIVKDGVGAVEEVAPEAAEAAAVAI